VELEARAQPPGGRGSGPTNFLEDPPTFDTTFMYRLHRQASRVNSVYNTEDRKKEEILPVIIAGIIRFLCLVYGLKFGNAKRFFV